LLMLQMFGAMHRDQMDRIREELDCLKQLTAELSALQAEAAQRGSTVRFSPVSARTRLQPSTEPTARALPGRRPGGRQPTGAWEEVGPDVPARLTERIAAIQGEQQNRWQKIRDFVRERAAGGVP